MTVTHENMEAALRVTIVIPTWCEATTIARTVASASLIADEVIVADGASSDATRELARAAGAQVVDAPRGRGAQLHAGALAASGDVLLFLHADARLPPEARAAVERALSDANVIGGNFHLRFVPRSFASRLFTWANDARRRWLRIYMNLLVDSFNASTVPDVMCRSLVSVAYDGSLHDCDFHQMAAIPLGGTPRTIWDVESFGPLQGSAIATVGHCFGCTAGAGSSCGGALEG